MDYAEWIDRERKSRSALLTSSPEIKNESICRACKDCGEICLCHEINCPNFGGSKIVDHQLYDVEKEVLSGSRICCGFRFKSIDQIEEQQNIP